MQYISSSAITCNKSQFSTFLCCSPFIWAHPLSDMSVMSGANQKQLQKFNSKTSVLKYTEANLQSNRSNRESSMQVKLGSKCEFQVQNICPMVQPSQAFWGDNKTRKTCVYCPLCSGIRYSHAVSEVHSPIQNFIFWFYWPSFQQDHLCWHRDVAETCSKGEGEPTLRQAKTSYIITALMLIA